MPQQDRDYLKRSCPSISHGRRRDQVVVRGPICAAAHSRHALARPGLRVWLGVGRAVALAAAAGGGWWRGLGAQTMVSWRSRVLPARFAFTTPRPRTCSVNRERVMTAAVIRCVRLCTCVEEHVFVYLQPAGACRVGGWLCSAAVGGGCEVSAQPHRLIIRNLEVRQAAAKGRVVLRDHATVHMQMSCSTGLWLVASFSPHPHQCSRMCIIMHHLPFGAWFVCVCVLCAVCTVAVALHRGCNSETSSPCSVFCSKIAFFLHRGCGVSLEIL
jgi:hypothetical protein